MATVSVVIPSYNRADELRRALASVQAQTLPPLEVIVCDDGSTEDLRSVTDAFGATLPLQYLRIANSGSPARPRNVAVAAARGEWIALLDSDDWWHPHKLERMAPRLGTADVLYHRLEMRPTVSADTPPPRRRLIGWRHATGAQPAYDMLSIGNAVPTSGAMVRRTLYQALGGMEERFPTIEDYDFWIRAALQQCASFAFVDACLGCYQLSSTSYSANANLQAGYFDAIVNTYLPCFTLPQQRVIASYRDFAAGLQLLAAGREGEARTRLRNARHLRTWRQRASRGVKLLRLAAGRR